MRRDHYNRRIIPDEHAPAGLLLSLVILALAFAVRLAYTIGLRGTPPGDLLLIDSETYDLTPAGLTRNRNSNTMRA